MQRVEVEDQVVSAAELRNHRQMVPTWCCVLAQWGWGAR